MRTIKIAHENFKRCAKDAPAGAYKDAKEINNLIVGACDDLMKKIRALGLKANKSDLSYGMEATICEVEKTIYNYVKRSNPDSNIFQLAEEFGASIDPYARGDQD